MTAIDVVNERLNGLGREILEEADAVGLARNYGAGLIEKESGGRNVFGCDHGDVGDTPPYCGQPVTAPRVRALRAHHLTNGVGPGQLTYDPYIGRADALGGAHIPRINIRVSFAILKDLLDKYPENEALGAYNAGEPNRWAGINNGYAGDLKARIDKWEGLLKEADKDPQKPPPAPEPEPDEDVGPDGYPQIDLSVVAQGGNYLAHLKSGTWARVSAHPNAIIRTDDKGWLWLPKVDPAPDPKPDPEPDPEPVKKFKWPVANTPPNPNSSWYVERNPERYSWAEGGRTDIEAWAIWLIQNFDVWVNTYHHHPESVWWDKGVSREYDSFDVWGSKGRGDPLPAHIGNQIFPIIFNDPNPPNIEWIIYNATMYGWWNWGGEGFGEDPFSWHYDHIHVTYFAL